MEVPVSRRAEVGVARGSGRRGSAANCTEVFSTIFCVVYLFLSFIFLLSYLAAYLTRPFT